MIPDPAATELASQLEAMFGLALVGSSELFDGGRYPVVRPLEPAKPNGFSIMVARSPLRVEAAFRVDAFARGLVSRMAQADEEARRSFLEIRRAATEKSLRVSVFVDGNSVSASEALPLGEWRAIEIECDVKLVRNAAAVNSSQTATVAATCLGLALSLMQPEDVAQLPEAETGLPEGARTRVEVNKYERSPVNRAVCIAHHGLTCAACGMDFRSVYGKIGAGFIHVHHRVRVSDIGADYAVNPIKDLVPLCPNCHAMVHQQTPPMDVEVLREILVKPHVDPA